MRFTIRDLFWLTVVVALAIGWWLDHQQSSQRIAEVTQRATVEIDKLRKENESLESERERLAHIVGHLPNRMFPKLSK